MPSMKTLLLELLIVANYHWYVTHSATATNFKYTIGALLSSQDIIDKFNYAVKTISDSPDNKRNNIEISSKAELMATNALKAAEQVCKLISDTKGRMFALIVSHPASNPSMPPLSASFTCAFYFLPVIGITARQSAFSDKYSHTSFLRTVPPYSQEAKVWADLIRQFLWKEVSFIYSDDQEGKTLLSRLERESDDYKHFKITRMVAFNADEDEDLRRNFTEVILPIYAEQTRAVVLYARKDFAEKVFDAAKDLGMLNKDWVWIVTEQALTASNVPQGVIGVKLALADEAAHVVDAVNVATQGIRAAYFTKMKEMKLIHSPMDCDSNPSSVKYEPKRSGRRRKGRRRFGPSPEPILWLDMGKLIYNNMTKVEIPDGKTGPIAFDPKGDRILPVYDIVNIQFTNNNQTVPVSVGSYGIKQKKPIGLDSKEPFYEMLNITMGKLCWPGNYTFTKEKEVCVKFNKKKECVKREMKTVPLAPNSFKKKTTLKVVTRRSIPFVLTRDVKENEKCNEDPDPEKLSKEVRCSHTDPKTKKKTFYCCSGYCIDLLRRLANRTHFEENSTPFDYDLHLVGDGEVGQKSENESKGWTGIVGELINMEADLAVAPMTITPERAARIEFTKPFKYLGLTILVKREKAKSNLASFLQPFENTMWVLVGLSVHVVALVLYLLDRFSPFGRFKLAKSSDTEEDALNLSSAMWFAWGVLLNSGIGEGTPRSFSARVLGMVWAGFAMIIVASYTANLAAFLVLDRPEATISGIDDARLRNPQKDFDFATVKGSPVEQYFKRQVEYATMYRTMEANNLASAEVAIQAVKDDKLKAFIWDSARLNFEASSNCELVTAGEVFGRTGYGLAMKKDNPWLYEMSQAVLNFHERGFMERLDTQWILVKKENCDRAESSPATLGLTNMAGVFIMVAAGIVAGVLLIFIEIAYKKRRGLKEKELELAKNAADRWRGNIEKRKILRKTLAAEREAASLEMMSKAEGASSSQDRKRPLVHLANQNGVYFDNEGQV